MGSLTDREIAARCTRVAEELRRQRCEPPLVDSGQHRESPELLVDNGQYREPNELEISNGQMKTRLTHLG